MRNRSVASDHVQQYDQEDDEIGGTCSTQEGERDMSTSVGRPQGEAGMTHTFLQFFSPAWQG